MKLQSPEAQISLILLNINFFKQGEFKHEVQL